MENRDIFYQYSIHLLQWSSFNIVAVFRSATPAQLRVIITWLLNMASEPFMIIIKILPFESIGFFTSYIWKITNFNKHLLSTLFIELTFVVKYLYTTSFYHNWLLVKPDKTQAVAPKNTKIYANMFNIIELKFRKSDAHFLFEKFYQQ